MDFENMEKGKRIDMVNGAKKQALKMLDNGQIGQQIVDALGVKVSEYLKMYFDQYESAILELTGAFHLEFQNCLEKESAGLLKTAKALEDHVKQFAGIEKKAAKILTKYKWFVCPSMPIQAVNAILIIAKKKGRKDQEINHLFIHYFSQNDWKVFEEWICGWSKNSLFKKRIRIFKNCVTVLKLADRYKFNGSLIVLPTLIAQIEGIITDYLHKSKAPRARSYSRKKKQFRTTNPKVMTDELNAVALDFILDILFQATDIYKPLKIPFNFNRHKILHGKNVKYGRKDYVVRAIMVLDFLAWLKVGRSLSRSPK